jgi:hypothetical protein
MFSIPHCLDNQLTDGGEVISLTHQTCSTPSPPKKQFFLLLLLISVRSWVNPNPRNLVLPEELGKLKTFNDVIGTRTSDLAACSIAPQPLFYRVIPFFILKLYETKSDFPNTLLSNINTTIEMN